MFSRDNAAKNDTEFERLRMTIRDNIITPAVKARGYGGLDPERFAAALDQLALACHSRPKTRL